MVMPVSISARQISAAAKSSVTKALEAHKDKLTLPHKPELRIGFIPPYWWIGFVLEQAQIEKATLANVQTLATDVHRGIAGAVHPVADGKPGVILGGGHIICGFLPPPGLGAVEE